MKILTRHVVVTKTAEEVSQILKSSAYYVPKPKFEQSCFSMHCAKRHHNGGKSLILVKGTVSEFEDKVRVKLEIHADLVFYYGIAMLLLGIIGIIYGIIAYSGNWLVGFGIVLIGLLLCAQPMSRGSELLDLLEHILTR